MAPEFVLFSCNLPNLQIHDELAGADLTPQKIRALLENTFEAIRKSLYNYAPIDKAGIAKLAEQNAKKIGKVADFITVLKGIRPSALEEQLKPYFKDDRDPEKVIGKKLAPVTDIALGYYFSVLFERLFPINVQARGKPSKKEFRFAANCPGWLAVRKVNLEIAEQKEVLACMVHTLGTIDLKLPQYCNNPQFFSRLQACLGKYPPRKSFGKLILLLEEMQDAGMFSENDLFLRKHALYKALSQLGYSPCLSGEMIEGIYPELKIPKPRGRMKKN
ncbi:MAG: hypothetical protein V1835_02870 [Candidatus Micrarchaeota archaeon]